MDDAFDALLITKPDQSGEQIVERVRLRDADLMEGDTTVAVEFSTVNYKDALALTGRGPIIRRYPMIPGVDFAGRVVTCASGRFAPGDAVVLNGFGVGESHYGGYAGHARLPSDWLIRLPSTLTTRHAMGVGTAGYTAALAIHKLQHAGLDPEQGPILVTGAAGGVGSIAIVLLSALGFTVVASSRRAGQEGEYLRGLGASEVIDAGTLSSPGKPLGKERWSGAIDSVGSHTLVNVLASTRRGGVVAACGLAQGSDLPGTVMPFILRGVTLAGIDSVMASLEKRERAWDLIATTLDLAALDRVTTEIGLGEVPRTAAELLAGGVRGRVVVRI